MSTAWLEFSKALAHLSGPGAQRERLALACGPALLGMNRKEIPREARAEFDTLIHLMGNSQMQDAAGAADLVARLSDPEVARAATKMLAIYDQLTRYQPMRAGFEEMPDKQKNDGAQKAAEKEQARC